MAVLLLQAGAPGARAVPGGPDLVGYLVTCAFVLALVLGAAWLVRRFLTGALRARAAQRSLQVVDVLPLGGRQRLVVVRCYDRTFLLGQGDKELRAIGELDVEAVALARTEAAPRAGARPAAERDESGQARRAADAFARLLRRATPGAAVEVASQAGTTPAPSYTDDAGPVRWSEPEPEPEPEPATPAERPRRPVLDGGRGILG